MTKADLVEQVFERIGSSRKEAAEAVEQVFDIIKENLCRGEKILRGKSEARAPGA